MGCLISHPSPQGSEIHLEEGAEKPWRPRGSRWLQGNNIFQIQKGRWTHIGTTRDCDSAYKTFINSGHTKFHHRGREEVTESYPEPRSYIWNWQLLKRENQFLQWSDNRYISHILGQDPYIPRSSQPTQNELHGRCCLFFKEREKTWSWVRGWRGAEKSWGVDKEHDQNILYKNFKT